MPSYTLPLAFALFVWWFSTGVIILLNNLPRATHRWSMLAATLLLGAAVWGIHLSSSEASVAGAYGGFLCGIVAWGWQEMSFFNGFVTGPVPQPNPPGAVGWRRFGHALEACLYHELAIVATAVVVVAASAGGANQVGTWTFLALWAMRQSAKLNVFLGVRNLSEEFVPEHLGFVRSYMRTRPINLLFPVSVSAMTVAAVLLVGHLAAAADPFDVAESAFLSTMVVLGLLEHWLLIVPLPATALWSWSLPARYQPRGRKSGPYPALACLAPANARSMPTRSVGGNR